MGLEKIVISASRRTDIPAFYMDWLMDRIKRRTLETVNPHNRRRAVIDARPENIHTIVFWSKNFGPFLAGGYGERLQALGFHLFFNFTINSACPILEPNLPPLARRLDQMERLCRRFDARTVVWRFDPICFYKSRENGCADNLGDFDEIADRVSACGITRCITSFMDHYPKIEKRLSSMSGFFFLDPPPEEKRDVLLDLKKRLGPIRLDTCCEKGVLDMLPVDADIGRAACISNDLLMDLFGGRLSLARDRGQRKKLGCGCMVSIDIGDYLLHPCYHNCLFCYANPADPGPYSNPGAC